ncbi:MAG: hypothetical protein WBN40_01625 [Pseudomonadales bacterium]
MRIDGRYPSRSTSSWRIYFFRQESWRAAMLRVAAILFAIGALFGCVRGMDISDEELVQKMSECLSEQNKTPGMAVSCGNYQKECKRRGKATGNYIC